MIKDIEEANITKFIPSKTLRKTQNKFYNGSPQSPIFIKPNNLLQLATQNLCQI